MNSLNDVYYFLFHLMDLSKKKNYANVSVMQNLSVKCCFFCFNFCTFFWKM